MQTHLCNGPHDFICILWVVLTASESATLTRHVIFHSAHIPRAKRFHPLVIAIHHALFVNLAIIHCQTSALPQPSSSPATPDSRVVSTRTCRHNLPCLSTPSQRKRAISKSWIIMLVPPDTFTYSICRRLGSPGADLDHLHFRSFHPAPICKHLCDYGQICGRINPAAEKAFPRS